MHLERPEGVQCVQHNETDNDDYHFIIFVIYKIMELLTLLFLVSILAILCGAVFYATADDSATGWLLVLLGGFVVFGITGYQIYNRWSSYKGSLSGMSSMFASQTPARSSLSQTPARSALKPSVTLYTPFQPPRFEEPTSPRRKNNELVGKVAEILSTKLPDRTMFPSQSELRQISSAIQRGAQRWSLPLTLTFRDNDYEYMDKMLANPKRVDRIKEFLKALANVLNLPGNVKPSDLNDGLEYVLKNFPIR